MTCRMFSGSAKNSSVSFMAVAPHFWINGKLLPAAEAGISPLDHGLLVGDGVFETLIARRGQPFAARRHYLRLARSCETMGIQVPLEADVLKGMRAVLECAGLEEGRIRVTVTSGTGPIGSQRGHDAPTVVILVVGLTAWPAMEKVVTVPWPRNERGALAGVKSTSYGENVLALSRAKQLGAGEAIFRNTLGQLCEGTGSNIFVAINGEIHTPPLDSGCLAGVTRALVIERVAAKAGVTIHETALAGDILQSCDEAFLTSTTRDVQPIQVADGRVFGTSAGPLTQKLQATFASLATSEIDP